MSLLFGWQRRPGRAPGAVPFRVVRGAFVVGAVSVSLLDCSSSTDNREPIGSGGGTGDDRGNSIIELPGATGGASTIQQLHPLCGVGDCLPDDERSCGGLGGESGVEGLAGYGGELPSLARMSCQLTIEKGCEGASCDVERTCREAGRGRELDPCFGPSDCAPGLACTGDGNVGSCRQLCCDAGSCAVDSYCDIRPQVGGGGIVVPVCSKAVACSLSEPFPCEEKAACSCTGSRGCLVVANQGLTACAIPGQGTQGDPCTGEIEGECAHGYVCSRTSGCLRVCDLSAERSACQPDEHCQAPPKFPTGFGVCFSTSESDLIAK